MKCAASDGGSGNGGRISVLPYRDLRQVGAPAFSTSDEKEVIALLPPAAAANVGSARFRLFVRLTHSFEIWESELTLSFERCESELT
jgi:hypothetical protein